MPGPAHSVHDDWEFACPAAGEHPGCRIAQRLGVRDTGTVLFSLTALRPDNGNEAVAILSAPQGVYLAPGITLSIDGGRTFKVLFETCNASGCHAGFPLTGAVLDGFRRGRSARVRIWSTKSEPVDLSLSLIGFSKAYSALMEGPQ